MTGPDRPPGPPAGPPPGWPPPGPPPGPPSRSAPPPTRRGRGLAIAGAIAMVLAVIGIVLTVLFGVRGFASAFDSLQRVPAAGGGTFRVEQPGTVVFFDEHRTGAGGSSLGPSDLEVTGPDGRDRTVTPASGATYTLNDIEGTQIGSLAADVPGNYRIAPVTGSDHTIAIAPADIVGSLVGGVLLLVGGILVSGLVGLVGLVLLIVGLVKRARSRRAAAGWGP